MSTVKVLDEQQQILFECTSQEIEKAWTFAKDMEALGVEVHITSPSLPETLAMALGSSEEDLAKLRSALESEIDSHGTCCGDDHE